MRLMVLLACIPRDMPGEPCDNAANNAKLLDALSDVEDEQRSADSYASGLP